MQLETLGKDYPIKRGVRKGDPSSPKLFSAVLENVFSNLNWEGFGLNINESRLNHVRFADNLVLFEEKPEILEQMIQSLSKESETIGLKMDLTKTKIMTNSSKVPRHYSERSDLKVCQ
ncbi:Retrovirus-related Pol polyprotein from type-1 retrotransposable element R2 [Eumeta japonica]|uniref:Retrovirus-related Pol polyprotein from type-1 retrotransposable element R2 n=1 Tax=Eumeta variegata TaxID=151549 RepID=A0A4C1SNF9_EUMVA|nr:Retrovirus-related Pol polyprotein from type-1 retrotransposable element R2 [Eumeta japonica]